MLQELQELPVQSLYTRYFFIGTAILFIIFAIGGFVPDYQQIRREHIPVFWFAHVHGVIMSLWLLLYLGQSILANKQNMRLHRQMGLCSISLAVLVWLSMGVLIYRNNVGFPRLPQIQWSPLLLLSVFMALFGLFYSWGIIARKDSMAHKRLIYLACMVCISAGYNRILFKAGLNFTLPWLAIKNSSSIPIPSGLLLYPDLLLIPLFIYDLLSIGKLHRVTILGTLIILSVKLALVIFWRFLP